MRVKHTIILIFTLLCFVGCTQHPTEQGSVPEGNKYATGFCLNETDSSVIVEVFQPYQRVEIKEPMKRLGTMSTVQVGFLYALDAMESLVAVCNPELIYTPVKGDEIDLGDSMKPSAERTLQAGLDVLLAVNYGQYDNLEATRLEKLGVFTLYINEWQEHSPLARAEWIRVLGALTGKLHQADSIFNEVESKYLSLSAQRSVSSQDGLSSNSGAVSIMSGNNFRGTWYVPSGKNYLAYLFKDAGAEMDEKHTWFKAFQDGRVYNWRKQRLPNGANNFWERGVVHPEEMLEDVIHILNNAPDSVLHFANRLY